MKVQDLLTKNRYDVNAGHPHIIPADHPDRHAAAVLVSVCPARLYQQSEDGSLSVDFHGCLECGACRLLCDKETLAQWGYPEAGYGITMRFG